jgi:hypothetical protein
MNLDSGLAIVLKVTGLLGVALMFVGLMEAIVIGGATDSYVHSFMSVIKGIAAFDASSTMMAGVCVIVASPLSSIIFIMFYSLIKGARRMFIMSLIITIMLVIVIFKGFI